MTWTSNFNFKGCLGKNRNVLVPQKSSMFTINYTVKCMCLSSNDKEWLLKEIFYILGMENISFTALQTKCLDEMANKCVCNSPRYSSIIHLVAAKLPPPGEGRRQ